MLLISSVYIFNISQQKYLSVADGGFAMSDTPVSIDLGEKDAGNGSYTISGTNGWVLVQTSSDTYAVGHADGGANADLFVYASATDGTTATTHSLPDPSFEPAQWLILQTGDGTDNQKVTLDESENSYTKPALAKAKVDVTLKRKFNAGRWNSLCLPFDMTAEQMALTWGADAKVAEFSRLTERNDGITVTFDETDKGIKAGTPCLIFLPEASANTSGTYAIDGIDATTWQRAGEPVAVKHDGIAYEGSYARTTVPYGSWVFGGDDKLHHVETSSLTMKGFRAYLLADGTDSFAKPLFWGIADDTPTAITNTGGGTVTAPSDIYATDGTLVRRQASSTAGLPRGVYIAKGKKIVVR